MIDLQNTETRFAVDAVRAAAKLARQIQQEMTAAAISKDDKSPVTVADYAIQALMGCLLERFFQCDALVGEEDAGALRDEANQATLEQIAGFLSRDMAYVTNETVLAWIDRGQAAPGNRFWTLDPIDGTKGFLRGEQYAVALALIEEGVVTLGVLGCPNLTGGCEPAVGGPGSVIAARRGEGTWAAPLEGGSFTRLTVSEIDHPKEGRVLRSVESGHTNIGQLDHILDAMGVDASPVRLDSQAKYGVLAGGKGDLLFRLLNPKAPDYREKIWDQAAGAIVVEEAGGRITDLDGEPLDFSRGRTLANNRGVLATNGLLHQAALDGAASVGA